MHKCYENIFTEKKNVNNTIVKQCDNTNELIWLGQAVFSRLLLESGTRNDISEINGSYIFLVYVLRKINRKSLFGLPFVCCRCEIQSFVVYMECLLPTYIEVYQITIVLRKYSSGSTHILWHGASVNSTIFMVSACICRVTLFMWGWFTLNAFLLA